jgi:hypothetical protein
MGGVLAIIVDSRVLQGFVDDIWGKVPLGRPRRKWEDFIKMYRQKVGFEGMNWIDVAQNSDRWRTLVNG